MASVCGENVGGEGKLVAGHWTCACMHLDRRLWDLVLVRILFVEVISNADR